MARRRPQRPEWLDWELEFHPHFDLRVRERHSAEVIARHVLEHYTELSPSRREGRWVLGAKYEGESWELVVEPDPWERLLVLVTIWST